MMHETRLYYHGGSFSKSEIILLLGSSTCYIRFIARAILALISQKGSSYDDLKEVPRKLLTQILLQLHKVFTYSYFDFAEILLKWLPYMS